MPNKNPIALSLVCTVNGKVKSVLRDELGLMDTCKPDCELRDLVDQAGVGKVWNFLSEVVSSRAVANWAFNIPVEDRIESLYISGAFVQNEIVVLATFMPEELDLYYDELMKISNDHANALRAVMKEQSLQARDSVPRNLYHDLMQLNNELANTQRELARSNAHLNRLMEEQSRFLGMVAHDLRSPLNVISGYSEFLMDDWNDIPDEERLDILRQISRGGEQMLHMVNGFLDYSKIESSTMELQQQTVDVGDLLREVSGQRHPVAESRQVQLMVSPPTETLQVSVDVTRMSQVLIDLLTFAYECSSEQSKVHLRAEGSPTHARILVEGFCHKIPEADIPRLFQPFHSSESISANERSSRLGLFIAHKSVRAHNGSLRIETNSSHGTRFVIELPLAQEES